MKLVFYIMIKN